MSEPDREATEQEDWRDRLGRFAGLDPDTDDRPQVMPVLEPEPGRQTHAADHERAALWDRAGGDDDEPDPGVDSKP